MYRGREGQWAFILHRLSGVALALFLLLHVVDISLVMFGPKVFNAFLAFYHQWPFRIGLILVMGGVIYHALNGLRIIIMDFTDWGVKWQRQMWYAVMVLTAGLGFMILTKVVPEIIRG
ncbi:MAG: succinate dehydrogenase, cytochrome b556 subunit [Deinococcales bacterium]